jgi:hypothetical protein
LRHSGHFQTSIYLRNSRAEFRSTVRAMIKRVVVENGRLAIELADVSRKLNVGVMPRFLSNA